MSQLVLIVEDEPKLAALLEYYLQQASFRTHSIDNGLQVDAWARENKANILLLD